MLVDQTAQLLPGPPRYNIRLLFHFDSCLALDGCCWRVSQNTTLLLTLPLAAAYKNGRWWNLLLARFALGFAVGAKSSTTPVYAAEWSAIPHPNRSFVKTDCLTSAPPEIRGALAMMWQ